MNVGIKRSDQQTDLHPMLDSAVLRFVSGIGFSDLSDKDFASIAYSANHEVQATNPTLEGFKEYIALELRSRKPCYEMYLRDRFERQLGERSGHIDGFAEFTSRPSEYPLSARLCIEWLERFVDLPFEIERQMVECIFYSPQFEASEATPALRRIAEARLASDHRPTPPPKHAKGKVKSAAVTATQLHAASNSQDNDWDSYWASLLCVLDSMLPRGRAASLAQTTGNNCGF
jgi:hypothetical protein